MLSRARFAAGAAALAGLVCVSPGPALAAPQPQPYRTADAGGFRNVLPPGANGFVSPLDLVAFQATGARPPHNDDQYALYRDLLYASPGLDQAGVGRFFKDASFGVPAGRRGAHLQPAAGRDDRARPWLRRAAHLRRLARGGPLGGGLRERRGQAVLHGHLPPPGPGTALGVRRGRARDPGLRPARVEAGALHRGRPGAPDRGRGHEGYERESDELRRDLSEYVAGINAYIAETRTEPAQGARRIRGGQPAPGPRGLEGHRRRGHGGGDRRDLRRGGWAGGGLGAGARGGPRALRPRSGRTGLAGLPPRRRPGVAAHRAPGPVPVWAAASQAERGWRFPTAGPPASTRSRPRRRRRRAPARRRPPSWPSPERSRTRSWCRPGSRRRGGRSRSSGPRPPTSHPRC